MRKCSQSCERRRGNVWHIYLCTYTYAAYVYPIHVTRTCVSIYIYIMYIFIAYSFIHIAICIRSFCIWSAVISCRIFFRCQLFFCQQSFRPELKYHEMSRPWSVMIRMYLLNAWPSNSLYWKIGPHCGKFESIKRWQLPAGFMFQYST